MWKVVAPRALLASTLALGSAGGAAAESALDSESLAAEVGRYLEPYVATGNFAGSILIARDGRVLFNGAYGLANVEHDAPNTPRTIYHLASLSRVFTCAAVQLLEQRGELEVTDPVAEHLPNYPNGDYQFGPDYYVPNRQTTLYAEDGDLFADWGGWLMPAGDDRFVERIYGGDVEFRRDARGRVFEMAYDGFVGRKVGYQATP